VAIANALQLEAARTTPVLSRFNYDAMPRLKSQNLYQLPYDSVFAADTLLYAVILTFDHEHCSVSPVTYRNFVPNLNAIEQSAAKLLQFKYLTE